MGTFRKYLSLIPRTERRLCFMYNQNEIVGSNTGELIKN